MKDATCCSPTCSLQKAKRTYHGPKIGATNLEAGLLILRFFSIVAPFLGPESGPLFWGHKTQTGAIQYGQQVCYCRRKLTAAHIRDTIYIYLALVAVSDSCLLNFTRSWGFGIFRVYWVSKSKMHHFEQTARSRVVRKSVECCDFGWISGPQVQLAFQRNWNSRKQSETVGNSRERPGVIMPKLSIRHFFAKKNFPRNSFFFWKCNGKQLETVGARAFDSAKKELFKTS